MPGILQREPRLYFSVNSMIGESILGFSNCKAQRTQGTHREQKLEIFQGLFSELVHQNYFKGQNPLGNTHKKHNMWEDTKWVYSHILCLYMHCMCMYCQY